MGTENKVLAKDVHKTFKLALSPLLTAHGYTRIKGEQGWTKLTDNGHLFFWLQCNKWGWDEHWGSSFIMEFQLIDNPEHFLSMHGRRERMGFFLEGHPEFEAMIHLNNTIIHQLPGTLKHMAVVEALDNVEPFAMVGVIPTKEPAIYGFDLGLQYYSLKDVELWIAFFQQHLLRIIEIFEKDIKSEAGLARARYDKAIGQMQNSHSRDEKFSILEAYLADEQDAHYRQCMQNVIAFAKGEGTYRLS